MKKQILILVLAIFAIGFTSTAFAQLAPRELECIDLDDPLNVVPGQPYTYEVDVQTPVGTKTYHWFVTQDVNMIAAAGVIATIQTVGGPILAAGSASYNDPTNALDNVTLTFQSFTLAANQYVFLGILVENVDALGCTTNNFKVYRIQPMHAFSLDIANVDDAGVILAGYGTDNYTTCIADIVSATYDPIEDAMDYDFGENTLYFAVAAANFSGSYELSVRLANLTLSQSATITWGYSWATVAGTILAPAGSPNGTYTATVTAQNPNGVGSAGETIYIRVVIDHGNLFEGNGPSQYELAVNGVLLSGGNPVANGSDVHHEGTTCTQADFDDIALQSLIPRPAINSVNPVPQGYLNIGN